MALIKCSECGRDVSDKASACPNCGCPVQREQQMQKVPEQKHKKNNSWRIVLAVIISVLVIGFISSLVSNIKKGDTIHLSDLTFEVDESTGRTYALKEGKAFDGIAYSDDENLFAIHVSDGRVDLLAIYHKNGKKAVLANMNFGEESVFFYDEEGNEMSAQSFYIAYPDIVAETINIKKQMSGL